MGIGAHSCLLSVCMIVCTCEGMRPEDLTGQYAHLRVLGECLLYVTCVLGHGPHRAGMRTVVCFAYEFFVYADVCRRMHVDTDGACVPTSRLSFGKKG